MAKKTKSRLKQLRLELEQLESKKRGKRRIFSQGRELEILLEIERIQEEQHARRSAAARKSSDRSKLTKEYNQLKKAIERMQKQGRTMMALPQNPPKSAEEMRKLSEAMKRELKSLAAETRMEAKHASSEKEKRRLEVKAKLDESWGPERDRLQKKLEDIHKDRRDKEADFDAERYSAFWMDDDAAVEIEEEPETEEEEEPEDDFGLDYMDDDEFPF